MRDLEAKGAHFQSLTEGIDTSTAQGRLTFHLMGALAEFERSLIVERTQAGLKAARKRVEELNTKFTDIVQEAEGHAAEDDTSSESRQIGVVVP